MSNFEQEENELDSQFTNSSKPRYTSGFKRIDRQVKKRRKTIVMLISVTLISLLLTAFVYLRNLINQADSAYTISVSNVKTSGLELSYDPNFTHAYDKLKGVGYGNTGGGTGGSLLKYLTENVTMFDKFKNLAENDEETADFDKKYDTAGANLSDQYYANKFFIKNTLSSDSGKTVYFRIRIEFTKNEKSAIDCVRFMYVNSVDDGTPTGSYQYHILAAPKKNADGTYSNERELAAEPETDNPMDSNFKNPNKGMEKEDWYCSNLIKDETTGFWYWASYDPDRGEEYTEIYSLAPGCSTAFTICTWLEGSDVDHNDSIRGGGVSFVVYFEPVEDLQI